MLARTRARVRGSDLDPQTGVLDERVLPEPLNAIGERILAAIHVA